MYLVFIPGFQFIKILYIVHVRVFFPQKDISIPLDVQGADSYDSKARFTQKYCKIPHTINRIK